MYTTKNEVVAQYLSGYISPYLVRCTLRPFIQSNVIYSFSCICPNVHLSRRGRTFQSIMKQHIMKRVIRAIAWVAESQDFADQLPASSITCHQLITRHKINPSVACKITHPAKRWRSDACNGRCANREREKELFVSLSLQLKMDDTNLVCFEYMF